MIENLKPEYRNEYIASRLTDLLARLQPGEIPLTLSETRFIFELLEYQQKQIENLERKLA